MKPLGILGPLSEEWLKVTHILFKVLKNLNGILYFVYHNMVLGRFFVGKWKM